ncbi:MAG: DUF6088 family protein [Planctomycetales bacterium]
MTRPRQSIDRSVVARIYGHGRGWIFTPSHFKGLGSRDAIASALKRHKQSGLIRRLGRGLYDYPKTHPTLGVLEPSLDRVAKALSGQAAIRLQPSGAYAANLLGLSTQVPMRVVYLTDGPSRMVQVGSRKIILKSTTPRNMATAGTISGLVIQALRHLGRQHVDQAVIARLDRRLDNAARLQLMKDIRYAPGWIADIVRELASHDQGGE